MNSRAAGYAFPAVEWPDVGVTATFVETDPGEPPFAVIVFAWTGGGFLLARVAGRGWCVPSGRIEPGESAEDAARRETREEVGAQLKSLYLIGAYVLTTPGGDITRVPAFVGKVQGGIVPPRPGEVLEIQAFAPSDIPAVYYRWDPLLEAVFRLAENTAGRLFRTSSQP